MTTPGTTIISWKNPIIASDEINVPHFQHDIFAQDISKCNIIIIGEERIQK